MTEKQAWRTIGKAYATPRSERSRRQGSLACCGICSANNRLVEGRTDLWWRISRKIRADLKGQVFFCACSPANDKLRADYCYLQYYMLGGK